MTQRIPDVYVFTESKKWDKARADACALAVAQQVSHQLNKDLSHYTVNFILAEDTFIQAYNKVYREKDKPTNVLSFPYIPDEGAPKEEFEILGDIMLAYETIEKEAHEQNKPFWNHVSHLMAHGLLHLLGYDHENEEDAQKMEDLEVKILQAIHIPNPYEEGAA